MGIFPWSVGLISIAIMLFWAQSNRLTEDIYIQELIKLNLVAESKRLLSKISSNASEQFREKNPVDKNTPTRQPLTTRLHLQNLFNFGRKQELSSEKTLFLRLINILYGHLPIFDRDPRRNEQAVEDLFVEALEYLSQLETKPRKKEIGVLATASFEEPIAEIKRDRFFHMLNGANGEVLPDHPCKIPRLFDTLTTDGYKKRSPFIAAPFVAQRAVLLTIFENEATVEAVLQRRKAIDKELQKDDSENKIDELKRQFEEEFSGHLYPEIQPSQVDFTVKKLSRRQNEK